MNGSRGIPERFRNGSGGCHEGFQTSRARADQGTGNRDQGTRDSGAKPPSIVKVCDVRARDAWMGLRP